MVSGKFWFRQQPVAAQQEDDLLPGSHLVSASCYREKAKSIHPHAQECRPTYVEDSEAAWEAQDRRSRYEHEEPDSRRQIEHLRLRSRIPMHFSDSKIRERQSLRVAWRKEEESRPWR